MQPSRKCDYAYVNLRHSHVKTAWPPEAVTHGTSHWALLTQATRWTSFRPLTEGSWGPKNGDCHLVVASILTDGDVLSISNHVLPHQVQICGTVWRVERTRTVTFKILFFISNFHLLKLHKAGVQVAKSILFKDMCLKGPSMTSKVDWKLQWELFIAPHHHLH